MRAPGPARLGEPRECITGSPSGAARNRAGVWARRRGPGPGVGVADPGGGAPGPVSGSRTPAFRIGVAAEARTGAGKESRTGPVHGLRFWAQFGGRKTAAKPADQKVIPDCWVSPFGPPVSRPDSGRENWPAARPGAGTRGRTSPAIFGSGLPSRLRRQHGRARTPSFPGRHVAPRSPGDVVLLLRMVLLLMRACCGLRLWPPRSAGERAPSASTSGLRG